METREKARKEKKITERKRKKERKKRRRTGKLQKAASQYLIQI